MIEETPIVSIGEKDPDPEISIVYHGEAWHDDTPSARTACAVCTSAVVP